MVIVIGGIVGWIAGKVMGTSKQMGVLADIIVGIVGSWIGSWLFGILGLGAYGLIGVLFMSVVGAALLLAVLKGLKVYR
jgi:uncharacterized membrane protein YeaQ/YmgE (transglycosylase-associated protein family)